MEAGGLIPAHAEVTMMPTLTVPIHDPEAAEKITRLIDMLEDLDDVQNVYTNADISEDAMPAGG